MHESIRLLDKALAMADEEMTALAEEREEDMETLSQERVKLVELAWKRRQNCNPDSLREKLVAMREKQAELSRRAEQAADVLREKLGERKRSTPAINSYFKTLGGVRGHQIFRRSG